jgi:hypothetical protein
MLSGFATFAFWCGALFVAFACFGRHFEAVLSQRLQPRDRNTAINRAAVWLVTALICAANVVAALAFGVR